MPEREGFPYDAEQARLDLELTRQELGETAQALAEKVRVKAKTTERVAITTGTALGLAVLILIVIRKLFDGR